MFNKQKNMLATKDYYKNIKNEWGKQDSISIPKIFFCIHNQKWYLTISDNKTIYKFLSFEGKTFVAAKSSVKIEKTQDNIEYYKIKEFDDLQVVSCSAGKKLKENDERFVYESILSLVSEF